MSRSRDFIVAQLQGAFRRVPSRIEESSILTVKKIIPNSVTLLAVVVGLSTVPLALAKHYAAAVLMVFLSGMLDGLDGPIARALHSTRCGLGIFEKSSNVASLSVCRTTHRSNSKFGAELDSLCDLINFGVAPTFLLYLWRFQYVCKSTQSVHSARLL